MLGLEYFQVLLFYFYCRAVFNEKCYGHQTIQYPCLLGKRQQTIVNCYAYYWQQLTQLATHSGLVLVKAKPHKWALIQGVSQKCLNFLVKYFVFSAWIEIDKLGLAKSSILPQNWGRFPFC